MTLSAQKTFENIKKSIEVASNIDYISKPSHGSANPNCEASFMINMKSGSRHIVNTSSIRKSNLIITLLEEWRKKELV